jgi:predicted O-methyltransferase YrrM
MAAMNPLRIAKRLNRKSLRKLYLRLKYGFIAPAYDGMMDEAKCRFLYDTVMHYSGRRHLIVEIGSFQGCSTTWLAAAGMRRGFESLTAIDLFTGTPSWNQDIDTYDEFMRRMRVNRLDSFVKPIRGNSNDVVKTWPPEKKISVLHIDAGHEYEEVKTDIDHWIPLVDHDGIVIFDDYDSTHPDVKKAIHELLNGGGFQIISMVGETKKGYGSIAVRRET